MTVEDVMNKIREAEKVWEYLKDKEYTERLTDIEETTLDILSDYAEMLRNLKVRDI